MDCQAFRSHFSEHFDHRLPHREALQVDDHLKQCAPCSQEWKQYSQLFHAVGRVEEMPGQRPFITPLEAPGALSEFAPSLLESTPSPSKAKAPAPEPARSSSFDWNRFRVAAAAAVLLLVTHVAVFEFARDAGSSSRPLAPFKPNTLSSNAPVAAIPAVHPQRVRRELKDFTDSVQLFARQVAQTPEGGSEEARPVFRAQLDVLDPAFLREGLEANSRELGPLGREGIRFVNKWGKYRNQALSLVASERPQVAQELEQSLSESGTLESLLPIPSQLTQESNGQMWRERPLLIDRLLEENPESSTAEYLEAYHSVLAAKYLDAEKRFKSFEQRHPQSQLIPLSRYMLAESCRRSGQYAAMHSVVIQLKLRPSTEIIMYNDPVFMAWSLMNNPAMIRSIQSGQGGRFRFTGTFRVQPPVPAPSRGR